MSSRDRRPRTTRRERQSPRRDGVVAPETLGGRPIVATESLGLRKMADVLQDFAHPLLAALPPAAERVVYERIYRVAAAVWNATAPGAQPGGLDEVVARLADGAARQAAQSVVDALVRRRREHFAEDGRVIAEIETRWVRGELRVEVTSIVPGRR